MAEKVTELASSLLLLAMTSLHLCSLVSLGMPHNGVLTNVITNDFPYVIASPSLPVILTLNEMKGKNLIPLRINSAWQSHNSTH